ncbi:hypothetical protein, partial [Herbiconiux daphne]
MMSGTCAAREFGSAIWSESVPGKLSALANNLPISNTTFEVLGSDAKWLAEGKPALIINLEVVKDAKLLPRKVGSLAVVTRELVRTSPELPEILQQSIISSAVRALDKTFCSENAGDAITPAGILHDLVATPASGSLATALGIHGKNGNDMRRSAIVAPLGWVSTLNFGELAEL